MTTITISIAGSSISGLTTNPSKTYTVSDTDLQSLLNWAEVAFSRQLSSTPTNPQILLAWIQNWVTGTIIAVQRFETGAPTVPAQIIIS